MNVTTSKQRGFTLIEVILVLAIAALIFLMIFVALPALQASQRDTARKNDAAAVASAVQTYVAGERQALTVADAGTFEDYLPDLDQYESTLATGNNPGIRVFAAATGDVDVPQDQIRVYVQTKCDGTDLVAGTSRSAAVVIQLEGGGGDTDYCVDV